MFVNEVQVSYLFSEATFGNILVLISQTKWYLDAVALGGLGPYACLIGHPKATMAYTRA